MIDGLSTSRKYSSLKETKCPLLTDSLTDWANSWDAIASKKELEGVSKELHVTAGVQGVPEGHQGVSWGFHRVSVHLDEF